MAGKLHTLDHPLVATHVTTLRDVNTPAEQFRSEVRRLTTLLAYEASKNLETGPRTVQTPLEPFAGATLAQRIGLVPILRAGLGMVDPILDLIPTAEVWHLGFYRDEETKEPVEYYSKLPEHNNVDTAFVIDPMLATGGSAIAALQALTNWGVPHLKLLCLIGAPEGVDAVQQAFPDVEIFLAALDRELNENAYIVPGLGDAGDRIFNAAAH